MKETFHERPLVTLEAFQVRFNALLKKYAGMPRDVEEFRYLHGYLGIQQDDDYQDLEGDACSLFVAEGGVPDWAMIGKAKAYGFNVYAGEKDSFGWITGCCEYKDHVLVFG